MAEACRSRTDQSRVYQLSLVLKTRRVTGPHALPRRVNLVYTRDIERSEQSGCTATGLKSSAAKQQSEQN